MEDKKQKYYDRLKNNLVGHEIKEIFYNKMNYGNDIENWNLSQNIHSIDMDVIFKMKNNKLVQVNWDNEFYSYGINIKGLNKINNIEGFKTIDLTSNSKWIKLLNKKILNVQVFWYIEKNVKEKMYDNNKNISEKSIQIEIPQTLEIRFETNDKIWISALEILKDNKINYCTDNLTIFFNEEELLKYKLTRHTNTIYLIKS